MQGNSFKVVSLQMKIDDFLFGNSSIFIVGETFSLQKESFSLDNLTVRLYNENDIVKNETGSSMDSYGLPILDKLSESDIMLMASMIQDVL